MTIEELYELVEERCHERGDTLDVDTDERERKKLEGYVEALQWILNLIEEQAEEEL